MSYGLSRQEAVDWGIFTSGTQYHGGELVPHAEHQYLGDNFCPSNPKYFSNFLAGKGDSMCMCSRGKKGEDWSQEMTCIQPGCANRIKGYFLNNKQQGHAVTPQQAVDWGSYTSGVHNAAPEYLGANTCPSSQNPAYQPWIEDQYNYICA